MLDKDIITQLKGIFASLKSTVAFRLTGIPGAASTEEMKAFLDDVASSSPRFSVTREDADVAAPRFEIIRDGNPTGIAFSGIPNGHEFTTLLLAVLNADGQGKNLPDEALVERIKALRGPIRLRTYVSLTCTNCPDVAQALNLIALYNPTVENMVIDGNVVPAEVNALNIQSVPAVYAGDELLSVGRLSLGELIDRLEAKYGSEKEGGASGATREYDVIVVGGGPAGASAAIYAVRKGFRTALVAKTIGGQVRETMGIENIASIPHITGPQLADNLREHIRQYPIDVYENRTVEQVGLDGEMKEVVTSSEKFRTPYLIIATGAGWRRLSVPGEEEHVGHGVAFCTHCDGPFYAGQSVAVVGGGNSGIEAALDLAAICPRVDVFEFTDSLKADEVLQEKAKSAENIFIHLSCQVLEIVGDGLKVSGLKVKDRVGGEEKVYPVNGVFVQIGLTPNSAPFRELLPLTRAGEIIVDRYCRTAIPGIYAAGDVTDIPYKQVLVAMGEGAKASLSAFEDRMRSR